MKKSLIFLFLFFSFIITNAQTKEETLAWIKQKIEKYGQMITVQSINKSDNPSTVTTNMLANNTIIQRMECLPITDTKTVCTLLQIKIDDIISVKKYQNNIEESFEVRTNGLKVLESDVSKGVPGERMDNVDWFVFNINWNSEADLYERFYNALLKLISYNKKNLPKEAF